MVRSVAAGEIEQTLRTARDEMERHIARYRVWIALAVVGIVLSVSLVTAWLGRPRSLVPPVYFLALIACAEGLRRLVQQKGAPGGVVILSTLFDLLAAAAIFGVVNIFDPAGRAVNATFAVHIIAVALSLVLMLNVVRANASAAVWGAALATFLYLAVLLPLEGFFPAQIVPVMIFWIMGGLGWASAGERRRTLNNFARLQLLRRYLAPSAVERVMRSEADAALSLGGQLLTITVLAADLRGFTSLSESLPPEEVVRQLNAFHGAMLEQIDAHDGTLDKFMGDGLLVVFGMNPYEAQSGIAADAGAKSAFRCAGAMLHALDIHNKERADRCLPPLAMGIGVHTGAVVAGNIGAPGRRLEFTVIGDAVNMAARLEAMTKEFGASVLVSRQVVDHLAPSDLTDLRDLGLRPIRGKKEAVGVFSVTKPPHP